MKYNSYSIFRESLIRLEREFHHSHGELTFLKSILEAKKLGMIEIFSLVI